MSEQNNVLFGVSAGATSQVSAIYPFDNKIESSDQSIKVGELNGHANITVAISSDVSVASVLQFSLGEDSVHLLSSVNDSTGLVIVNNGSLDFLGLPETPSILVATPGGLDWMPIYGGENTAVLAVNGGSFEWLGISDCANACEEETQE